MRIWMKISSHALYILMICPTFRSMNMRKQKVRDRSKIKMITLTICLKLLKSLCKPKKEQIKRGKNRSFTTMKSLKNFRRLKKLPSSPNGICILVEIGFVQKFLTSKKGWSWKKQTCLEWPIYSIQSPAGLPNGLKKGTKKYSQNLDSNSSRETKLMALDPRFCDF